MADVLVVDDDPDVCGLLETLLASDGHVVRCARDGRHALELLDQHIPSVILLDLMMPVMDGWEFRRLQRQRRDAASVPVVVLSARHDAAEAARMLGAAAAMSKPFDVEAVLETVRRHAR